MVLARLNPNNNLKKTIDLKNVVRNYKFTLTPWALFAPDGSIIHCSDKLKLIHYLKKNPIETHENVQASAFEEHVAEAGPSSALSKSPQIAIVDGMVLIQQDGKET